MPRTSLPLLVALAACSDYGLNKERDNPNAGDPDITVSPEALSLVVCEEDGVEVVVGNEGQRALAVDTVELTGEGWSLSDAEPFTVDPGETHSLALTAGLGEATLTLLSDDPDEPSVSVPLSASADAPPAVEISTPSDGEVVDIAAVETFRAQVSDDADAPDQLLLSWTSDVDGELSGASASADGEAQFDWSAADRSPGDHQLVLTATDSCGNRSLDYVGLCQQSGYVADELDISTWNFEGDASWDSANSQVQLTSLSEFVVGTAFQTGQTVPGDAVEISFSFYIGDGTGADGFSLTALDTGRMSGFLGGAGCGMGYGGDAPCTDGPALPGWSIEVDTFFNEGQDPTSSDHLTFTFDGDVDDPAWWVALDPIDGTGWHTMEVIVAAPQVTVSIDGEVVMDEALSGDFVFPAYVGFTAGTGSLTNLHLIRSLEVVEYVCGE